MSAPPLLDDERWSRLALAIANNATVALLVMDEHQRCTFMNPAAERLTGFTFAELRAKDLPLHDIIHHTHPDGRPYPMADCPIDRAFPTRMQERGEDVFIRPDGSFYSVAFTASPLLEDGRTVGTVIEVRETTAEKRAQAALEESRERYRHMFQSVGVSIWEEDFTAVVAAVERLKAEGVTDMRAWCTPRPEFVQYAAGLVRILDVNEATLRMFGARAKEELLGSLHRIFLPETLSVFVEELVAVAEGRTYMEAETVLRALGGERLDVLFTLSFPSSRQGYRRALVSMVDLTARKRAEEALKESEARFRNMADSAPVMLWVTDATGRCTYLSRSWYEFTGQTEETGLGFGWLSVTHPDDAARTQEAFLAANAAHKPFRVEYQLRRKDGEYRWAIDSASPRFGPGGEFLGYIGSVIDITERKHVEEEREALLSRESSARQEAEEANRLKDEFLATVSHELRTPLSAMLGWVQLLRTRRLAPDKQERALETIERNARFQKQLIEDLLDVSRILSGKLRLDVEPVDVGQVVEHALETVRPAAEAKSIRLQPVLASGARVMGDATRLQQVVWNLLSNAVKFTPKGGRVQVFVERKDSAVEVTVADTGQGIPPEFLPHVFERFRQAEGGTARRHGGLGLGLSIVKHVVEMHGGTVHVSSAGEGKGATFVVRLPLSVVLHREVHLPRAPPGVALAPDIQCPPELEGLHLLVVDDEADTRELLRALLEGCQARVILAASAQEGLEVLQREPVDLLVSDIGMPGEDGYSFIRRVRALPQGKGGRLPAIALTAYARVEDRTRALLSGFQSHVPKPVEPLELLAVLASLSGRSGPR
jgi:PAS domain S-box-containing protein